MSFDNQDLIAIASASYIIFSEEEEEVRSKRKKRRWWTTSLFKSRARYSGTHLMSDLKVEKEYGLFENFCRIKSTDFEFLLNKIAPKISRKDTSFREAIPAAERLLLTLRFLASGDSFTSLMFTFKISKQLISRVVPEVCTALVEALSDYVRMPSSPEEWLEIAKDYEAKWNFPHCLGAVDGKHCIIQAPINSGSDYFNYKQYFSIVLFGVADANYCLTFADVGCQGRISDGGVFRNSLFGQKLQNNQLNLPPEKALENRNMKVPYVFVGDDAFSLHNNLLKAYPVEQRKGSIKRIFNYRLCRARRIIENVFGIICAVFRVLRKPILLSTDKATKVILACIYLHNFLRKSKESRNIYTPPGTFDEYQEEEFTPGAWRQQNDNLQSFLALKRVPRKSTAHCEAIRNEFAEYFSNEGSVTWQHKYA